MNIKFIAATLSFLGLGDREGNDSMAPHQPVPTKLITLEKLNLPTVIGGISLLSVLSLLGYSMATSSSSHSGKRDLPIPCAQNSNLYQDASDGEWTRRLQEQKTPLPRPTSIAKKRSLSCEPLAQSDGEWTRRLQEQKTPLPGLTSIAKQRSLSCELVQEGKIANPSTSASEITPLPSRLKQSVSSLDTADSGHDTGTCIHAANQITHRHVPDSTSIISSHGQLTVDA